MKSRQHRVRAWGRCVRRYAPYGYPATLQHLRDRFGSLDDPAALEAALSALERSRAVWLGEVATFAARRRSWKAAGRRRARRARRLPPVPGLFDGWAATFGCGGSTLILAVVLVWGLADPSWWFWVAFVSTWLTVLIVAAVRSMLRNDQQRLQWAVQHTSTVAAADAAERRWAEQRRCSFDTPP